MNRDRELIEDLENRLALLSVSPEDRYNEFVKRGVYYYDESNPSYTYIRKALDNEEILRGRRVDKLGLTV